MAEDNKTTPPPPPAAVKHQFFVAVFNIVDGGVTTAPGGKIKLTREQFDELKPLGAIDGEWK